MSLAAVCNVKRGDSTPLEHVGHYMQPRDRKTIPIVSQITGVALGLATWEISAVFQCNTQRNATVRNHYKVTRYVRDGPAMRQLRG